MTTEGGSPEEAGKHLAQMIAEGIGGGKFEFEITTGATSALLRAMQRAVRESGGDPVMPRRKGDADACWVLVKGYHDSGTIDGVFGPYDEAYIDWLLKGLLEYSSSNWTKVKLSAGPEHDERLRRLADPI